MRFLRASAIAVFLVLILFNSISTRAETSEQTVSGRLLFENGDFPCDRCLVSLLANGVRPIATAYVDLAGHFNFSAVPKGAYVIHVEIDGFEDVNQPIDISDISFEANVLITLT